MTVEHIFEHLNYCSLPQSVQKRQYCVPYGRLSQRVGFMVSSFMLITNGELCFSTDSLTAVPFFDSYFVYDTLRSQLIIWTAVP